MPGENLTSFHVREAIQGEEGSLEWVLAHFDPLVEAQIRMKVRGRLVNDGDIKDILSEVWLVTLNKLSGLDARDGRYTPVLVKFLSTTAERTCMDYLRKQARRQKIEGGAPGTGGARAAPAVEGLPRHTAGVVSQVHRNDVRKILARSIDRLSEPQRDVLVMRFLEQRTNTEVAEILGLRPNTVAVRYRRALAELARLLPNSVFEGLRSIRNAVKGVSDASDG